MGMFGQGGIRHARSFARCYISVSLRRLASNTSARTGSSRKLYAVGGFAMSASFLATNTAQCLPMRDAASSTDGASGASLLSWGWSGVTAGVAGLWSSTMTSLAGNQFATGGLAVLVGGTGLAMVRSATRLAWAGLVRRVVVRAEFDSRDDSYRWVIAWLAEHPHFANARRFSVLTSLKRLGASAIESDGTGAQGGAAASVLLIPSGTSVLRHGGRWMLVERNREDEGKANSSGRERESLTLHILGGSKDDLLTLVSEARRRFEERQKQRTAIYFIDEYGSWTHASSKPARPATSVILSDPGQVEALLGDCRRFLAAEHWYGERGIPYRRGYLFHGPPGTGKTSLVAALASELRLPIYVASLSSPRLSDDSFAEALACAAAQCILLLEDVDAAFVHREPNTAGGGGGLTFSGLLNAIDGVAAQEGRMLFMTTNHPEKLDPALVRPGRVDVRLAFSRCSTEQVRTYCRHFYGAALSDQEAAALAAAVPPDTVSVAQLQGALMQHPEDPAAAARECRALFSEPRAPAQKEGQLKGARKDYESQSEQA